MFATASRSRIDEKTKGATLFTLAVAAHFWLACPAASAHSHEHCERLLIAASEASNAGSHLDALQVLRDIEVSCPPYMGLSVATLAIRHQGEVYWLLKLPRQALAQADRCLQRESDAGCLFLKGRALIDLGQRDDGLQFISAAIALWEVEIGRLQLDPPSELRQLNIDWLGLRVLDARRILLIET